MADIEVWTIAYASADNEDIGCGASVFLTEAEAREAIVSDVCDNIANNYDDVTGNKTDAEMDADIAAEQALIRTLTTDEVIATLVEQQGEDYAYTLALQKHTLTQPDFSTPDAIEEFLS